MQDRLACIVEALRKLGDAYTPLVKALAEKVDCCRPDCNLGHYSVRSWDEWPDGALVGPVWKALRQIELSIGRDVRNYKARSEAMDCRIAVAVTWWDDDSNAAVCDALETWLGLKTEARDAKV